ncbi:MAG: PH domain-containing protein [Actinomycetales bacterium]|nr:PH domain-containing protein [Actinomycetales bacterium]
MPSSPVYATFRPRATRAVSIGLATATIGGGVFLLIVLSSLRTVHTADTVTIVVMAAGICAILYRQWSVRAVPTPQGLTVRNFFLTRTLEWAEIVSVRFGDGGPWVQLDLADGTVHAVMAIQRSDGAYARAESRRLATLVAAHEGRGVDPGGTGG